MTDSSNTTAAVPTFQVAIDCADPHLLARFWAEALAYTVEDHHDEVLKMIELGFATREDAVEMDGRLSWPTAAACADPHGVRPRLLFQHVPEAKTVKNRLHLDLRFGAEAHDREVARFEALGARRLWDGQQGPHHWTTMADPEGNEFCVA